MNDREHQAGTDLYQILGVVPEVDSRELVRAYRGLLRRLHPDTYSGSPHNHDAHDDDARDGNLSPDRNPSPDLGPDLGAVLHAYEVLRDPVRRARYDAAHTNTAQRSCDTERDHRGLPEPGMSGPGRVPAQRVPMAVPVRHRRTPVPDRWLLYVGPVRAHRPPRLGGSDR